MAKAIRFGAGFFNVRLQLLTIDCTQRLNPVHGWGVVFARDRACDPRYLSKCRVNATVLAPVFACLEHGARALNAMDVQCYFIAGN